jgi:hypothetical protein
MKTHIFLIKSETIIVQLLPPYQTRTHTKTATTTSNPLLPTSTTATVHFTIACSNCIAYLMHRDQTRRACRINGHICASQTKMVTYPSRNSRMHGSNPAERFNAILQPCKIVADHTQEHSSFAIGKLLLHQSTRFKSLPNAFQKNAPLRVEGSSLCSTSRKILG